MHAATTSHFLRTMMEKTKLATNQRAAIELLIEDHRAVQDLFKEFEDLDDDDAKRDLVTLACAELSIHAQVEEEIFYPALFAEGSADGELDRSITDHDEMRVLIQRLRQMSPRDAHYDGVFRELIRKALHHVADEETTLLPLAEVKLADQLRELGWKMTLRRFELLQPHMAEAASTTAITFPVLTGMAVAGLCTAAWLLVREVTARE